jgi:hypothetical protein
MPYSCALKRNGERNDEPERQHQGRRRHKRFFKPNNCWWALGNPSREVSDCGFCATRSPNPVETLADSAQIGSNVIPSSCAKTRPEQR